MCSTSPDNVTVAKKAALDRAAMEFGLMSSVDIKSFIVDGLENTTECKPSESDQYPGTTITAYKFTSGAKKGYLAFHPSLAVANGIHIKSLHLDDTDPALGTLGDIFKDIKLGGNE